MQDALLDAVEAALATVVEGTARAAARARRRRAAAAPQPHLQLRGRRSTAAEVLGVAPKSYLPNYREFYERRQLASGRRPARRHDPRRRRRERAVRPRPALRRRGPARPRRARRGLRGHVGAGAAEPRGGARRARPCCSTSRAARSPSAAPRTATCSPARRVARAATPPTSTPRRAQGSRRPTCRWDGQTMIYENGVLLGESERFPDGARRSVADVDLDLLRQERHAAWGPSTTTAAPHAADVDAFRAVAFTLEPPAGDLGLRRTVDRFPFVPADDERLALDCYEAYNIQVAGLEQRLRGDRRPEGRHRRLRRPRLHPRADRRRQGDGPARPPAHRHPRLHAARASRPARDTKDNAIALMARSASPARSSTSGRPRG